MANHKSAIKRHKQSLKKADRNRAVRTRVKNVVKEMRTASLEKNPENIEVALKKATIAIDKSASKGVLHWKTAARKISRLAKAVNAAAKAQ